MSRTINIDIFNIASIDAAVREIRDYATWIKRKAAELAEYLANRGAVYVSVDYSNAFYDGDNDISVHVERRGESSYAIVANGEAILFVEFGAGVTYGYGHPNPSVNGIPMGPGTYPSDKGHWNNPKGWYMPGSKHTYGNPPSMAMYNATKDLQNELEVLVQEVFASD